VWLGPDQWLGPPPPSVLSRWLRTVSTAAQTGGKTGETTGAIGETTAGTVAAEPTRRKVAAPGLAAILTESPWWLDEPHRGAVTNR
jgi:hypothetical protein